jgi:hypothetical protein
MFVAAWHFIGGRVEATLRTVRFGNRRTVYYIVTHFGRVSNPNRTKCHITIHGEAHPINRCRNRKAIPSSLRRRVSVIPTERPTWGTPAISTPPTSSAWLSIFSSIDPSGATELRE